MTTDTTDTGKLERERERHIDVLLMALADTNYLISPNARTRALEHLETYSDTVSIAARLILRDGGEWSEAFNGERNVPSLSLDEWSRYRYALEDFAKREAEEHNGRAAMILGWGRDLEMSHDDVMEELETGGGEK